MNIPLWVFRNKTDQKLPAYGARALVNAVNRNRGHIWFTETEPAMNDLTVNGTTTTAGQMLAFGIIWQTGYCSSDEDCGSCLLEKISGIGKCRLLRASSAHSHSPGGINGWASFGHHIGVSRIA